jgi:hypothetical protein
MYSVGILLVSVGFSPLQKHILYQKIIVIFCDKFIKNESLILPPGMIVNLLIYFTDLKFA